MRKFLLTALPLLVVCLPACGLLKPRFVAAPCQPQWSIPAQYKTPSTVQPSLANLQAQLDALTLQLKALQPPASKSMPTAQP